MCTPTVSHVKFYTPNERSATKNILHKMRLTSLSATRSQKDPSNITTSFASSLCRTMRCHCNSVREGGEEEEEEDNETFLDDMKPKGEKRVHAIFETIRFGSGRNKARVAQCHILKRGQDDTIPWSNKEKELQTYTTILQQDKIMMIQNKAMAIWMFAFASLLVASPVAAADNDNSTMFTFPTVGDKVGIEGHVMVRTYVRTYYTLLTKEGRPPVACMHACMHACIDGSFSHTNKLSEH